MMIIPIISQRLSTRDDDDGNGNGDGDGDGGWGPLQVATPAIVGGVLLLFIAAYIIWTRRPHRKRSYDYHQVQSDWVAKIERIFISRRTRQQVHHSSAPMTLDDSMRTSGLSLDFRRARQYRSGSSDSQTPLTMSYNFDYPPIRKLSDSPPPMAKRRSLRWWRIFGSRPREVKSQEPSLRWRVDGSDGSSTGHGHSSQEHEEHHVRYTGGLEAVQELQEEAQDAVIQIGGEFGSIASTPMTQHFPGQVRAIHGMSAVPEYPPSGARSPAPMASAPQSNPGTPSSSVDRGLPPSYDVSQSHTLYTPAEDTTRLVVHSESYMLFPPPVRAAGYPSPRSSHGRELSSDSLLATQSPMVTTSIY